MAAEKSVETVLCILMAACVSPLLTVVTAENATHSPKSVTNPTPSPEQLFVDETIRLITAGENNIALDDSIRDLILLVGKTGTGKTTMTKFIAQPEKLESYNNGERFLIRDFEGDISGSDSGIISKTIFPNLIIDNSTGNAFYDMPGFSDTRNASIEIANAWFMKTVAEHAERVKIVFVVTHSSLVRGGNRKDIVTLLKMATDFIKNPSKFKNSISLIATKVDEEADAEDIINDVGDFLGSVKTDLRSVIDDSVKRGMASDLLDAFLVKYPNGTYSRISFFLQPVNDGPLTAQADVMELRHYMRRNLVSNTVFVATSPNDFGISLSHDAMLSAAKVAQVMNQMIADAVTSIGNSIVEHFKGKKPSNSVGSFLQDLRRLEVFADTFSPSMSRQEFIQELQVLVNAFKIPELQYQLTFIANRGKNLEFFEQVSRTAAFAPNIQEWFRPITIAIQSSRSSFSQMVGSLNRDMTATTNKLNSEFQHKIRREVSTIQDPNIRMQRLTNFSQTIQQFLTDIPSLGKSYNKFAAQVRSFLIYQGELTQASEIYSLKDDIPVQVIGCQVQSPLKMSKWLPAFENLLEFVEEEEIKLKSNMLDEEKLKVMRELDNVKGKIQSNMSLLIATGQREVSLLRSQGVQLENRSQALLAGIVSNCKRSWEDLVLIQGPELVHLGRTTEADIISLNATMRHEQANTLAEEAMCNKTEGQLRESLNFTIHSNKDILKHEQMRRLNRTATLKAQYADQVNAYQARCSMLADNSNDTCQYLMSESQKRVEERNSYYVKTLDETIIACNLTLRNQKDICNHTLQGLMNDRDDHKTLMEGKIRHQNVTCEESIKFTEFKCNERRNKASNDATNEKNHLTEKMRRKNATCEDQISNDDKRYQNSKQELRAATLGARSQCILNEDKARTEGKLLFDREKISYLEMWEKSGRCCNKFGGRCLDGSNGVNNCCGVERCGFWGIHCCGCESACRMPQLT